MTVKELKNVLEKTDTQIILVACVRCLENNWAALLERENEQYAILQKSYDDGFLKAMKEDSKGGDITNA